ncbi:DUF2752 domain-containing protein [Pseudonocardia lutea]|uniref:DUF2752 domain-containing protein n=1 Tax=Pseudonocardia lutea TaxID=2172015 RepID=A0ABW1I495_9PSEU
MVGLGLQCPFHEVTGLFCPACGATRAVLALARGDVLAAGRDNALLLMLAACSAIALVPPPRTRIHIVFTTREWPTLALCAVLLAFAVVRNLPGASFLRPPA